MTTIKRILAGAVVAAALIAAVPAAASAAYSTSTQAEEYIADRADDYYTNYSFDDVRCYGRGRSTDGDKILFRKFRCETDFVNRGRSFKAGFTTIDRLSARGWGFRIQPITSYWWS